MAETPLLAQEVVVSHGEMSEDDYAADDDHGEAQDAERASIT